MSIITKFVDLCTEFRNPIISVPASRGRLVIAEIGYIACIPFAIVSTALCAIASLFGLILSPIFGMAFFENCATEASLSLDAYQISASLAAIQLSNREGSYSMTWRDDHHPASFYTIK